MARKELMANTEETRECVTRMLRRKVKTMRSEEDGIYIEGFLPFSLMEEVVEYLRTAKNPYNKEGRGNHSNKEKED